MIDTYKSLTKCGDGTPRNLDQVRVIINPRVTFVISADHEGINCRDGTDNELSRLLKLLPGRLMLIANQDRLRGNW